MRYFGCHAEDYPCCSCRWQAGGEGRCHLVLLETRPAHIGGFPIPLLPSSITISLPLQPFRPPCTSATPFSHHGRERVDARNRWCLVGWAAGCINLARSTKNFIPLFLPAQESPLESLFEERWVGGCDSSGCLALSMPQITSLTSSSLP